MDRNGEVGRSDQHTYVDTHISKRNYRGTRLDRDYEHYIPELRIPINKDFQRKAEKNAQPTRQSIDDYGYAKVNTHERIFSTERRDTLDDMEKRFWNDISFKDQKPDIHGRANEGQCSTNEAVLERYFENEGNLTWTLSSGNNQTKIPRNVNVQLEVKREMKHSPSNIKIEANEEERYLQESRKQKELILKEMESVLREKDIELSNRERELENKEREKEKQVDPYEELLNEKERMTEQKFKEMKQREEKIKEREYMLSNNTGLQRMTDQRAIELQKEKDKADNTELKQANEEKSGNKDSNSNANRDTEMEAKPRQTAASDTQKSDTQTETIEKSTLDRTFYFPKFSIFSGEDPRPKTESTFEEWKYEVSCLRKDKIYSDTVIGQAIRKSLKGQAKKVLLPMGSGATVEEILERLEGVFGNVATSMSILQEFYSVSQKIDESVAAWGLRLEEILQRAIEKGQVRQEDRDEMLRNKFWRSLRSEKLRLATRTDFQSIKNFDLLRKKVRAEEYEMKVSTGVQQQAIHTERKVDITDTPDSKMDLLLQRLSSLENQMKEMNKRRQGRFNYRPQNQHQKQNQNQNTAVKSATEPKTKQEGTPLN